MKDADALRSSVRVKENMPLSALPASLHTTMRHSPWNSLSSTASSSLHSPPEATTCSSLHCLPSFSVTILMSAIGESFTIRYFDNSSSSSFSPSTSGLQSSIMKTFFPLSARLAGSRKMIPGRNPSKSPAADPGESVELCTDMPDAPRVRKLCRAAWARAGSISL